MCGGINYYLLHQSQKLTLIDHNPFNYWYFDFHKISNEQASASIASLPLLFYSYSLRLPLLHFASLSLSLSLFLSHFFTLSIINQVFNLTLSLSLPLIYACVFFYSDFSGWIFGFRKVWVRQICFWFLYNWSCLGETLV